MVKVAVTGANSGLALEIIDKLVENEEHNVIAISRKDPSTFRKHQNIQWVQNDYGDNRLLVEQFRGVEVVLDFAVVSSDPEGKLGKFIIDAAIEAGVKRFAPSEWFTSQKLRDAIDVMPWYAGKVVVQDYLAQVNKDKKILEYCLFQPGIFLDYYFHPHQVSKHVPVGPTFVQLEKHRIVAVKGYEDEPIVATSVRDIAAVVKLAIEFEGEWPTVGGISGTRLSPNELKTIGEKIKGGPVTLELAEVADLQAGILKVSLPRPEHPSIPEEQRELVHAPLWSGLLLASTKGTHLVTDEWNRLLPDYSFESVEDYAARADKGRK